MENLKKSRFIVGLPLSDGRDEPDAWTALYHTMTGAFVLVPASEWPEQDSLSQTQFDPKTLKMLIENGLILKAGTDETAVFECWKQQQVHDYSTITSKTLLTRRCNNRCTYCILDPEAAEMSAQTARDTDAFYLDFIDEKRPLCVMDDYLGGEPLLKFSLLLESAGRRLEHCRRRGIDYRFTITTNGVLLDRKKVQKLEAAGISGIRVSLAGPAQVHDRLRPTVRGGKTYGTILRNLKYISGLVPVIIECQYDSGSEDYRRIPEMLLDFQTYGIDVQEVHFSPILQKRGDGLFNCGLGDPGIALGLMRLAKQYGYSGERRAPAGLCRADFRAMFVFDTDGSIIPCPGLQKTEMAYGHVSRGVDFVSESQLLVRRLPERCLSNCALLPLCMGGCRQQALVHGNDFAGIDCHYDTLRLFLEDYMREKAAGILAGEATPAEIAA